MQFIKRAMSETITMAGKMFGAVLVTGPRQVGKTTLMKELVKDVTYVSLDNPLIMKSAVEEGGSFFQDNPPPIFIDEVQNAPNLLQYIKIILDDKKLKGLFYMSGSQQFKIMKNVSESLAGRLGIVNLLGLSLREINGTSFNVPFLPTAEYFEKRRIAGSTTLNYDAVWRSIQKGSLPELYANPDINLQMFYGAYVKTYIERDVRDLTMIGDNLKFLNFMTVIAASTSQMLNLAGIARDVGISQPTASRWLDVMCGSGLVYLLHPYSNNITNRTVKSPKVYFLDTGLAAYLTRWNTTEGMKNGSMAGAFFETFVVSEIIKSYYNAGYLDLPFYYYKDKDMKEINLLIEQDGILYPLSILKHANPDKSDILSFSSLDKLVEKQHGPGGIICMFDSLIPLKGDDKIIPVSFI